MPDKLIEFLKNFSIEELQSRYAIAVKTHPVYPNLHLLKYDQIDSPMDKKIVQLCRGIILDRDNGWKPVCFPYRKFFNHGEGHAAPINWKTARVYEKLDGSLMQLYHYDGRWHVASSGTPDAGGLVNGAGTYTSFADLFWKVWENLRYKLPTDTQKNYFFELMTPYNRIVVRHRESKIVLHGVRNLQNYSEEFPEEEAQKHGWECVKSFPLTNIDEIAKSLESIDPMTQEGYIVCDRQFHRAKCKAPQYVALHHAIDGMTTRKMLELIRINETAEFLSYFPEWGDLYKEVEAKFTELCQHGDHFYAENSMYQDKKEFALRVKDSKFGSVAFAIRSGHVKNAREFYSQMPITRLEEKLGLKSKLLSPGDGS